MAAENPRVDAEVSARMRKDWNDRAREDANYYVAFGRHGQDEDEFFATGAEVVASVEWELRHMGPAANPRARRALEIGCGPGRLMRPLSRTFGEIHGVDVSDEMIRLARERLRGIPHAHVHWTDGASLAPFADESFDMVYSYAVFQHIPSREVVFEYLREIHRVLKVGGLLRAQFNGLPQIAEYNTWAGARFSAGDLREFTRGHDFQMLALEGVETQYMWTTWRKQPPGWRQRLESAPPRPPRARIRRITNALNGEPVAPSRGRYASVSIWTERLPRDADLFDLDILANGQRAAPTYIGPPDHSSLQQVNVLLPELAATGLVPVEMRWFGAAIADPAILRVIPPGPRVPRILSISDGIDLLAGTRIETRSIKVVMEELERPDEFQAFVDGIPAVDVESLCADPQPQRYEINFRLPEEIATGPHLLEMRLGRRLFGPMAIEVAR
jgi:SAM-dependent methyltransferase